MTQDADQVSERIADVEPRQAARLGYGAVLNLEGCLLHPPAAKDVGVER